MGFRELFLEQIKKRRARYLGAVTLAPEHLQAFTRRDIATAINLYRHLQNLGSTFENLIDFTERQAQTEATESARTAVRTAVYLTREERRHLKKGGGRRRQAK